MSMSQNKQNSKSNLDQKKKSRRTRKDENGRDYFCACGKSYLSYPALYTHIKTKHDGKAPLKLDNGNEIPNQKQELQQLKILLSKNFPERLRGTPRSQIVEGLSQANSQYIGPMLQYWQEHDVKQKQRQKFGSSKKQLINADLVFGKFLFEMNKRVNSSCINFLCRLMIYLRKGICREKKNPNYCLQCTASMIPNTFNELILHNHIPPDPEEDNEKLMQDSSFLCKIIGYFSTWMYKQQYTNCTVKYKGK